MRAVFHIQPAGDTPIYRQIVERARKAVATGALVAGDALPSVRGLAEQLVINPNTVARAYGELVRDGLAESRAGKGLFICRSQRTIFSAAERRRRLDAAADAFLGEALFLDFTPEAIREAVDQKLRAIAAARQRSESKRP